MAMMREVTMEMQAEGKLQEMMTGRQKKLAESRASSQAMSPMRPMTAPSRNNEGEL